MAPSNVPAALLLLLLLAASGPLRPTLSGAAPLEPVEVSLLAGAQEKGAVCLDGTPPGYHLQRGSGDGSGSWLVHLEVHSVIHPFIIHPLIFLYRHLFFMSRTN